MISWTLPLPRSTASVTSLLLLRPASPTLTDPNSNASIYNDDKELLER